MKKLLNEYTFTLESVSPCYCRGFFLLIISPKTSLLEDEYHDVIGSTSFHANLHDQNEDLWMI